MTNSVDIVKIVATIRIQIAVTNFGLNLRFVQKNTMIKPVIETRARKIMLDRSTISQVRNTYW